MTKMLIDRAVVEQALVRLRLRRGSGFADDAVCITALEAALAQPQIQRPLPPGTVIEYCGLEATVVDDQGGRTLTVDTCGAREEWEWVLDGATCTVVALPQVV